MGTLGTMSLNDLERKAWVKRNLRRAREHPVSGEPLTLFRASLELKVRENYITRWENPAGGSPGRRVLPQVIRWIEKRLGEKAPA